VLTRVDGDGRGGAALSMRAVTGKPIKLIGTGEKLDGLENFHPERIAGRILGMGDVVSLVERAAETIEAEQADRMAERMRKGAFDLDDLSTQLGQMQKLGGMSSVMGMLPGIGKMKKQIDSSGLDDGFIKRHRAIISSMTRHERRSPKVLNASRKKRIAAGSGTSVQEVNKLLKMHRQMADTMKKLGKNKGMLSQLMGRGDGMTDMPPEAMAEAQKMAESGQMPGGMAGGQGMPGGLPGLGGAGGMGGMSGGLPGFGGMPGAGGGRGSRSATKKRPKRKR